ncbi:MAG: hypothetical protein R3E08_13130 [Thiotrichaceae bacterium]
MTTSEFTRGYRALSCGENLYSFSPKEYLNQLRRSNSLATGIRFGWRVWSPGHMVAQVMRELSQYKSCVGQSYISSSTYLQWGVATMIVYRVDIPQYPSGFVKQAAMCNEGCAFFPNIA